MKCDSCTHKEVCKYKDGYASLSERIKREHGDPDCFKGVYVEVSCSYFKDGKIIYTTPYYQMSSGGSINPIFKSNATAEDYYNK